MRHISDTTHQELENLYTKIVWPLDKKFGTAYDAMKISLGYYIYIPQHFVYTEFL